MEQIINISTEFGQIDKSFDSDRFIKMRLRVMHNGINPNGSNFEDSSIEDAKWSLANIPLLANVVEDEDGNLDFGAHDIEIEQHKMDENSYKLVYKEIPIGIIPETNNYEYKEYRGKNYVYTDAYVFKDYSNYAEDIIAKSDEFKISMEITVDEYQKNKEDKNIFDILKYKYTAITMLGTKFGTGMVSASAEKFKFNREDLKSQFAQLFEEIKADNLSGGTEMEEVDVETDVVVEDFKEVEIVSEEVEIVEETTTEEFKVEEVVTEEPEVPTEIPADESFTVKKHKFELSFSDIEDKIYTLLNVNFDEDGYRIYDYWINQIFETYAIICDRKEYDYYKVSYVVENDEVMIGEKVKVYSMWLTEEEKDSLESMKSEYSAHKLAELEAIESEITAQKDELFEKYDELMLDNEEYNKVKEAKSDYSLETLESTLALIYVKSNLNFSLKEKKSTVIKLGNDQIDLKPVVNPYGSLFNNK